MATAVIMACSVSKLSTWLLAIISCHLSAHNVGLPFLFRVIWPIDSKLPQVWNWAAHRKQYWEYLCVTFELAQLCNYNN